MRTIFSFLLAGLSPPASVVPPIFLPQSPSQRRHRQHLLYSPFPAGSWRQLSAPPLSLLFFILTTGVPSACPCMPCALAPHSLQCRQLGPLHTHQDLSSMGETRTGCQSPGADAKMTPKKRGKCFHWFLFIHIVVVVAISLFLSYFY